jgi:molybdopterin converting factor small subunit
MAIVVLIPGALRPHAGGANRVELEARAGTVAQALAALWAAHPGLRGNLLDERGVVRQHINIFVGVEDIRWTGGLDSPVPDGAEISIIPAVSGGGA